MAGAPIIRTCNRLLLTLTALSIAAPALAVGDVRDFARARAADGDGRTQQAAARYAEALAAAPGNPTIARRAYREALEAGDDALALRAIASLSAAGIAPFDSVLFSYADAVRTGNAAAQAEGLKRIDEGPFDFLLPSLRAWQAFESGGDPFVLLDAPGGNLIARRYSAETRALLLIATGKEREGALAALALLGTDTTRVDFRLSAAQLLVGRGQGELARPLLAGDATVAGGHGIKASAAIGVSRLFTRVAADIATGTPTPFSITITRAALLLEPGNDRARLLLAEALGQAGNAEGGLATLDSIAANSPFRAAVTRARIALLQRSGDSATILAATGALANTRDADAEAIGRYGDALIEARRYDDAARAYAAAIRRAGSAADWSQHLKLGGALDQAGRWREAEAALGRAYSLAPDQPATLNYLAFARIEHGEKLAESEAMLEQANKLKPNDSSIIDSLAWAYYVRGNAARAVPLLERAARGQPGNSTINEHLGDAYWSVGRRYEARYAWRAATIVADTGDMPRLAGKIAAGLPTRP